MGALCGAYFTFLLYKGIKLVVKGQEAEKETYEEKSGKAKPTCKSADL